MGCEGGVVLSLCSPTIGTGTATATAVTSALLQGQQQQQHPQQQQQQQPTPHYLQYCPWLAVVTGLCGFAGAPIAIASPPPGGLVGGNMVVLTWKGRSVTAHHIPVPRPHVTPPPAINNHNQRSSHNGGGEHSSSSSGSSSTDDKELGAFWELLDREIRPLPPLANSTDSQQIFTDHKEMARAYLVMQQELFNLRKSKTDLEGKLSEAEQLEQMNNHRYQDKIRQLEGKRENLRNNHKRLRQQLEHIRSQAARGASHPPP